MCGNKNINKCEMQRRNSKGNLQAQPGQLGLFEFDFGGRQQKGPLQVKAKSATSKPREEETNKFN